MESQVLKSGCEKLGIFLNEKQESQFKIGRASCRERVSTTV